MDVWLWLLLLLLATGLLALLRAVRDWLEEPHH
jgi:hypothetical protein